MGQEQGLSMMMMMMIGEGMVGMMVMMMA